MKGNKGITLIALIITIIIMLILAIVSVNLIVNQGILTKSKTAVDKHQIAAEKEAIQIGYSEYIADKYNGTTPLELKVANAQISEPTDEGWTITFNKTNNVYTLSADGKTITGPVIEENEKILTDEEMQAVLQSFTQNPESYVHSEQSSENKDRAIGTDGQAVNLDLWKYIFDEESKVVGLVECDENGNSIGPGYSNDNIVNGKIKGTVPQYIYIEEKKDVYTVKYMGETFKGCTSLRQGPTIPNSVINMDNTFEGCTNLTQVSRISSNVISMIKIFEGCTSLTQAPEIPNSVTEMFYAFRNCTSLTKAPVIPSGVTDLESTFNGCTSLQGTVRINSNNIDYAVGCFSNITNEITVEVPEDSTTYNTFNSLYGSSSNIKIATFKE